ncbi:YhfG family protein [Luteibacter aegosomatissinici]|uniref:YhfG family protein n=1 Tax=Luteibacter aegosomatissinici TaxID=2911539 RepID=UPI003CCD4000
MAERRAYYARVRGANYMRSLQLEGFVPSISPVIDAVDNMDARRPSSPYPDRITDLIENSSD